ncbi:MAG: M48 family metalloprotease [Candidatus Omnitrophica bacterium]|nr:M48 family metalloprotease [Candidatus Omnitrophota bacterium]
MVTASSRWWLSVLVGVCGCAQSSFNLATQQEDYTLTSTQKEVAMGRKLALRVEEELPRIPDEPLQARVEGLGRRLAAVCDRQELAYRFVAVEGEEVNAFALPGGYVYVYRGLLDAAKSDDELAGVLAHELGHIAARHSVKRYEVGLGAQLLQLATLAAARRGDVAQGLHIALRSAQLAYARQDEMEADRLGVKYLKAAGFDPKAMLEFLKRLDERDRAKTQYMPRGIVRPYYARSHPYVPERIRVVKEALYGSADYIDYLNTPD